MNITQMAKALEGLTPFKYIFVDCCNMVSAETGYELRNATEYLIGSPAEIPGWGAPYDKIMPSLFKNGSDMYRGIVDAYWKQTFDLAVPYWRMSFKWLTASINLYYKDFDQFDTKADGGCVSMFIPQNHTSYTSGNFAFNKKSNNFGWNRIINWSRFGW